MTQRGDAKAGISNLVFDVNKRERAPWHCCSNSSVPWSEVFFFVQIRTIVLMIIPCFTMLFLLSESCEEKYIWPALLSSLVGYILTNPKLWIILNLQMTRSLCQLCDPVAPEKQKPCLAC